MEIIARRLFSPIYIYFDIAFLVLFLGLLIYKKKYMTVVVGLLAGVLYFLVDYGIFHLLYIREQFLKDIVYFGFCSGCH